MAEQETELAIKNNSPNEEQKTDTIAPPSKVKNETKTTKSLKKLADIDIPTDNESKIDKPSSINNNNKNDLFDNNVDEQGFALLSLYLWDVGEDDDVEGLIDSALRLLLLHPTFDNEIWKKKHIISQIYNDNTFWKVPSMIPNMVYNITNDITMKQIKQKTKMKGIKFNIFAFGKKNKNDDDKKIDINNGKTDTGTAVDENAAMDMDADELFYGKSYSDDEDDDNNDGNRKKKDVDVNDYAFWNVQEYKKIKDIFKLTSHEKETYFWAFLIIVAATIKYLEIEISAMAQFDLKNKTKASKKTERLPKSWKGFIIPPTMGSPGVNYVNDDDNNNLKGLPNSPATMQMIQSHATIVLPASMQRRKTVDTGQTAQNCYGCYAPLNETKWYKHGFPYCHLCLKFRVYQECVRKFVLEYDNEEILDDLWPWYENTLNSSKQQHGQYKEVLQVYGDQVIQIESIKKSNLKYMHDRQERQEIEKEIDALEDIEKKETQDLTTTDTGSFFGDGLNEDKEKIFQYRFDRKRLYDKPYRNIRYLRKFAAMFMLADREIWKDLYSIKKNLRKKRGGDVIDEKEREEENENENDNNEDEKMADYRMNKEDKEFLKEILEHPAVTKTLYKIPKELGFVDANYKNSLDSNGYKQFLKHWHKLPHWWEPMHDRILMELALEHKLDLEKYLIELDENDDYQEELETHYYKAFEFWCTQKVNVISRLRVLTYTVDRSFKKKELNENSRLHPLSRIFINDIQSQSHVENVGTDITKPKSANLLDSEVMKSINNLEYNKNDNNNNIVDISNDTSDEQLVDADDEKPVRNVEREFRDIVQLLNPEILGVRIWRFIMEQISMKQKPSLWKALTILAEELPTNMVILMIEEDAELISRGRPKYVNAIGQSIVKGSTFPVATALYVSSYMEYLSQLDLAKANTWLQIAEEYEDVAIFLTNEIESDHLLALFLEIPTDIEQKTIVEIAVSLRRAHFLNDARITNIMKHVWSECEYINPERDIKSEFLNSWEQFKLLFKSPVRFYFCPMGLYVTQSLLYIIYVFLVSYVIFSLKYPYDYMNLTERIMWICNVGYILGEILEMEHKRAQYFAMDSITNVFDVIISVNWILLGIIRFFPTWVGILGGYKNVPKFHDITPPICDSTYTINFQQDDPWVCRLDEDGMWVTKPYINPKYHNKGLVVIYMLLMGLQIIVLWVRLTGILQRTAFMGPLLGLMFHLMKEIATFFLVMFFLLIGFAFAVYYVSAGDLDRDTPNIYQAMASAASPGNWSDEKGNQIEAGDVLSTALASAKGVGMYLFHTLLGQQDWDVLNENSEYGTYGYNFGRDRSQVLTGVMIIFVLIASLTLLNMLIAIMTTSFEEHRGNAQKELAFLRVESTYELSHRGRVMPAPFNIFAFFFALIVQLISYMVQCCTCNKRKLNLDDMNPLYVKCLSRSKGRSLMEHKPSRQDKERKDKIKKAVTMLSGEVKKQNKAKQLGKQVGVKMQQSVKNLGNTIRGIKLGELFDTIDELSTQDTKLYCKHCYFKMRKVKGGSIDKYFEKFDGKNSYSIDPEDIQMIKKYFRRSSLCPQCYRPYKLTYNPERKQEKKGFCRKYICCCCKKKDDETETDESSTEQTKVDTENTDFLDPDRYSRWHVILEIVSCWLFIIFISWILMLLFLIPGLFNRCCIKLDKAEKQERLKLQQNVGAGSFGDYHKGAYHSRVKKIVEANGDPDEVFMEDDETFGARKVSNEELIQDKLNQLIDDVSLLKSKNSNNNNDLNNNKNKIKKSKSKHRINRSRTKSSNLLSVNLTNKSEYEE